MTENVTAPQLVILDFDRTLGDAGAAMERLYAVLQQGNYTVNQALIAKAQQRAEESGKSFSPLQFMKEFDDIDTLWEDYLHYEDIPLLYDDAGLVLQVLEAKNVPYMVMSYGEDLAWQELKIRASGYDGPLRLLEHKEKGRVIAVLAQGDNYVYETEKYSFRATSVCLIDDKAESFADLPEDCTGIWLRRSADLLPSQQGDIPANVRVAAGLDELTDRNRQVQTPQQGRE